MYIQSSAKSYISHNEIDKVYYYLTFTTSLLTIATKNSPYLPYFILHVYYK